MIATAEIPGLGMARSESRLPGSLRCGAMPLVSGPFLEGFDSQFRVSAHGFEGVDDGEAAGECGQQFSVGRAVKVRPSSDNSIRKILHTEERVVQFRCDLRCDLVDLKTIARVSDRLKRFRIAIVTGLPQNGFSVDRIPAGTKPEIFGIASLPDM